MEYQQLANTIDNAFTKSSSTIEKVFTESSSTLEKDFIKSASTIEKVQVTLKKSLPNHSRTSPFSGLCSSYESPEQQY